jgi:hypothetical protein
MAEFYCEYCGVVLDNAESYHGRTCRKCEEVNHNLHIELGDYEADLREQERLDYEAQCEAGQ